MELNLNLDESENENESIPKNENNENNLNNKDNTNINPENNLNRDMFEFITVIGKGGFGKVWKVQYKKTNEYFALKEMSKRKILDKKSEKSINSERKFLSILNHPFIVNMHYAFQDNDNLYLVMDMLSGGDLRYHCSRYRTFSEEQTRFFIACITYSLEYIHSNNVIHRDIKPENLVLDEKGYVCITDFGIAKYNTADNSSETSGTPGYMSPEVMNAENHTFTADFFAIGVIGFEFLMGYRPYNGKNRQEIKEKIFSEQVVINQNQKKNGWSDDVIDFINKLLERNKGVRLGANNGVQELKDHQWLKYYPWDELEKKNLPAPFVPEEIDNFDKSYCESEERITEQTKLRYKKIFSSSEYQNAFVDFFFNKEMNKFKRKQEKSKNVRNLLKQDEEEISKVKNEEKDKSIENKNYPEIISLGSDINDNKNIDISMSDKIDKSKEIDNKNLEQNKKEKEILNNSNNIKNKKSPKNEKTEEEEIILKKMEVNSEGNQTRILESNSNIHNIKKESTTNSVSKLSENPKYINQYNTNNFIQINNFKKVIINPNDYLKKKTKEDFFFKEYIKYHSNNKKPKKFNYMLKLKKGNKHSNTKNSSMIFNSSKKENNNSDYIINNNFPKRDENDDNIKNRTIFKQFVLFNNNNNISNANITNNFIMNNNNINYNNYNKDKAQMKYQKLKLKKKNNNSFRINHIKNLFNGQKINFIKKLYMAPYNERNESLTRKLDQKNYDKTYMYYHTKKDVIKMNEKKIPKLPVHLNNKNYNSNLSGDNSDNYYSYKTSNISLYKLNNTNNDFSFNYANSLSNISYKDKNFNFIKKIPKFKSSEKNIIFNRNNLYSKSRTNSNMKIKNFERINSAGKFKSTGVKIEKINSIKNNAKKSCKEKMRANSNKKDFIQNYLLS